MALAQDSNSATRWDSSLTTNEAYKKAHATLADPSYGKDSGVHLPVSADIESAQLREEGESNKRKKSDSATRLGEIQYQIEKWVNHYHGGAPDGSFQMNHKNQALAAVKSGQISQGDYFRETGKIYVAAQQSPNDQLASVSMNLGGGSISGGGQIDKKNLLKDGPQVPITPPQLKGISNVPGQKAATQGDFSGKVKMSLIGNTIPNANK